LILQKDFLKFLKKVHPQQNSSKIEVDDDFLLIIDAEFVSVSLSTQNHSICEGHFLRYDFFSIMAARVVEILLLASEVLLTMKINLLTCLDMW